MITNRIRGFYEVEAFWSVIVGISSFTICVFAQYLLRGSITLSSYSIYGFIVAITSTIYAFWHSDGAKQTGRFTISQSITSALGHTSFIAFFLLAYAFASRDQVISRVFLFTYLPVLFVCLVIVKQFFGRYLAPRVFERRHCDTILVGDPTQSARAEAWINSKSRFGFKAKGWLTENFDAQEGDGALPVLGTLRHLERVLKETGAKAVIVTNFINSRSDMMWVRNICEASGVRLAFALDFGEGIPCGINCYYDDDISLITLRDEPLESPLNRFLKRLIDIAISLPVVLLVLPIMSMIVRIFHLIQSPGSLMFNQERVGLHGRTFMIYKFRTMHMNNPDEARQVTKGDSRIFPFGGLMRKLSIDEFPQFLNVLQGDMSIVGPRPHMSAHDDQFSHVARPYKIRHFIKPGITGLAQVSGQRGPTPTADDVVDRTKSDLFYLENWTLKMDVLIILKTFLQLVKHNKGAM